MQPQRSVPLKDPKDSGSGVLLLPGTNLEQAAQEHGKAHLVPCSPQQKDAVLTSAPK